jgi:molybdenum cofactor cytidylyltransferase
MGDFKQLLAFGSKTIVETTVERALASKVDEVLVVVGHRGEEVAAAVARLGVRVVRNEAFLDGMSSSIKAGVRAVGEGADAVMICLGDQPHVPVAVYDAVLAAYRASGAPVVVPTIAGDTGHPVVFDLSLRDEMLAVDGTQGMRSVTYAHRSETLRVPVDTVAVLDDIDTPDDYERLRR